MKNLIPFSLLTILLAGCSSQTQVEPSEFPLGKGNTWVYAYKAYESSVSDPAQITEGIYQLTETVVEMENVSNYFVAYVKKDYELRKADVDWPGGEFTDNQLETWYIANERQVFESRLPVDTNNIQIDDFLLAYEFPLSLSKSWCWLQVILKSPNQKEITNCEFVGKRMVTNNGVYESPAGKFDDCYELTDYSNGGNIIHWFCKGVGIVYMKFDHAGNRFGFEQTLLSYSVGVP